MAEIPRFGSAMMGYSKADVDTYIHQLAAEYDRKLKQRENDLEKLRNRYRELEEQLKELRAEREQCETLVRKAREDADRILQDARSQAEICLREQQEQTENDRQNLARMRERIREFRLEIAAILSEFDAKLLIRTDEPENESYG